MNHRLMVKIPALWLSKILCILHVISHELHDLRPRMTHQKYQRKNKKFIFITKKCGYFYSTWYSILSIFAFI